MPTSNGNPWPDKHLGKVGTPDPELMELLRDALPRPTNIKHDAGKVRFDLLPFDSLTEVAKVYQMGAEKYAVDGWRGGMSWRRIFAAMLRHSFLWALGQDTDTESGLNHMAHVAWGCLTLLNYAKTHPELDDRVKIDAIRP